MLAKTPVHHFSGNNVSSYKPQIPKDQVLCTSRACPAKKSSCRSFGGHEYWLTLFLSSLRSSSALPVVNSTDAPPFQSWTLVTQTFCQAKLLHKCIFGAVRQAKSGVSGFIGPSEGFQIRPLCSHRNQYPFQLSAHSMRC